MMIPEISTFLCLAATSIPATSARDEPHVEAARVGAATVLESTHRARATTDRATTASIRAAIRATPLRFVPCAADSAFQFAAQGLDHGLFLDGANATIVLNGAESAPERVRFELSDACLGAVSVGEGALASTSHVYRGADPAQWRESVPNFARVRCADVYPGIDVVYYGSQDQLEYDFVLAPGADPCAIAFKLVGAQSARIDERGDLRVSTNGGELVQHAPIAYQDIASGRVSVAAQYELEETTVRFCIGAYDASAALVIDPVVTFSTFLGGSNADQAWDFDIDAQGNVCVAGYTASTNFPHTAAGSLNGFWDMYVAKFNATGTALIYSTFLSASGSGTSVTEFATGIACDALGNAYVTGRTNATDFPTLNARQPLNAGGTDAVVLKLDATGQLVFSTYHGGAGDENGRYDNTSRCGKIAVDSDRFVYVTGMTNSTNFPLASPLDAIVGGSSCVGGCTDIFVSKFTPDGQSLVFSTFIGDTLPEEPVGILVDASRDIYIGANQGSILFHKIAADGQSVVYTRTIQNGPDGGHSQLLAFDVDPLGRVVLTGLTTSGAFPTTPGTWQPTNTGCFSGTCEEAFVTLLAADNGPILASTYVGLPTYNEAGTAIRFDLNGDIVFALRSRRDSGPWFGELWKFDPTLTQQLAKFTICGSGEATDLFVDAANNVSVIGWVWNGSSPVSTPGAFQPAHGGNIDVFLSAFDMQSPPPGTPSVAFCFGDGSGTSCPCGNASPIGGESGCLNSLGLGGKLSSLGLASLAHDSLVLHGTQMPSSSALYFQGTTQTAGGAGAAFGDGLRCAAGAVVRLSTKANAVGASMYPEPTDARISVRGSISGPGVRTYQVWYRNAAAFCTASTFNLTSGCQITWGA
jgi:hypothetical protein